jgi:hypothetical protein
MWDWTGEYPIFESTDHFFQVNPEISRELDIRGNEVDLLLITRWPYIRDSKEAGHWEENTVNALVPVGTEDGTAIRIASLVLRLRDWIAAESESIVAEICQMSIHFDVYIHKVIA